MYIFDPLDIHQKVQVFPIVTSLLEYEEVIAFKF